MTNSPVDALWGLTPFFFERPEPALGSAIPDGAMNLLTDPGQRVDRTPGGLKGIHGRIHDFARQALASCRLPISIAGDCLASLPVMSAVQAHGLDPVIVWMDAHGDFNTPDTSHSGFLGGMPLAMMVGRGEMSFARLTGPRPVCEADVYLVGARDLDPLERPALEASDVTCLSLPEMAELTFERPVHLHIDNDVINPLDTSANNYVSQGGPRLPEVIAACQALVTRNRICAISFSGWNGSIHRDGKTARHCA